jgi:hypothetical protein
MTQWFLNPKGIVKIKSEFARSFPVEYKFERLNHLFESENVASKDYERIKEEE